MIPATVDRCRLFKCDVSRLQRDRAIGASANILRKRAGAPAEHFVARFELRDVFANCLNCSCIIDAQSRVLWFAQTHRPSARMSHIPRTKCPSSGFNGCRANSDQDLIVCRSRLFDLLKLEISYAVVAIDNSFHRIGWE